MPTRYKFLRETIQDPLIIGARIFPRAGRLPGLRSDCGIAFWEIGQWKKAEGDLTLCKNGFHCSAGPYDALFNVLGEILALAEVRGNHLEAKNKECWEEMRIIKAWKWQKKDALVMDRFSAGLLAELYQNRELIHSANLYQQCPCEMHGRAVWSKVWDLWQADKRKLDMAKGDEVNIMCNEWMENYIQKLEPYEEPNAVNDTRSTRASCRQASQRLLTPQPG